MGCSTGGPQTLEVILGQLPAAFPAPIIVVQHMPAEVFTQSMARHLDAQCALVVKEAGQNEKLLSGVVYLVPGGHTMSLSPSRHSEPEGQRIWFKACKPEEQNSTIDKTMLSIAHHFKESAIGVILTGMGHDGVEGMRAIKRNGGKTMCEDESAMIFGMPKAVIDCGIADIVLPAQEIGNALIELVGTVELSLRGTK